MAERREIINLEARARQINRRINDKGYLQEVGGKLYIKAQPAVTARIDEVLEYMRTLEKIEEDKKALAADGAGQKD